MPHSGDGLPRTRLRNCLKSSWMTPYGGSSVVRNAQMGLLRAVSCTWQATDLEPIRTFQTVSLKYWQVESTADHTGTLQLQSAIRVRVHLTIDVIIKL